MAADLQMRMTLGVVLVALLLFFQLLPVTDTAGGSNRDAARLLAGFANPALIAVASMLVVDQGLMRTGLLKQLAGPLVRKGSWRRLVFILVAVAVLSGIMNNTPVVVVLIPILQALAGQMSKSASDVLMPPVFRCHSRRDDDPGRLQHRSVGNPARGTRREAAR